jgi:drug/metabolite transporter (DMT)-like permease
LICTRSQLFEASNCARPIGILAAALNTTFGGLAVGVTRYVIPATDPITLGAMRFGIGGLLLLPFALLRLDRWPRRGDLAGVVGLGLLYFGLYPVLFNAALAFTTAARGALALSTAPLFTMLTAAILRIEPLTSRKALGVLIATMGVATAIAAGMATAPVAAWRGDLLMLLAALCSAFYSVWSRPFIERSAAVPYTVVGMMVGVSVLAIISWSRGSADVISTFDSKHWIAVAFLSMPAGALAFYLLGVCPRTNNTNARCHHDDAEPNCGGHLWRLCPG